jgi:hypothetical protein
MVLEIRDDRHWRSLTGLSQAKFEQLLCTFTVVYQEAQQAAYEAAVAAGTRQRQLGGGAKGKLPTPADKLLFVLYYYKTYPTFDVLGTQFGLVRSKAHKNLYDLSLLLHKTLVRLEMLPHREFKTPAELQAALHGIDHVIIDATERAYRRSQEATTQREHYSGKRKQHTVKNTVMSRLDKFIVFLGRTFTGHNHDYSMLKEEFPPELDWFIDFGVAVDLGYLGIKKDYAGDQFAIPHKKPRKSKDNPNPQLTDEQKATNKAVSQVRIFVEHAIGGLKRYNILVQRFRNHKENFEDDVIGIAAGLWNFALS